MWLQKRVDGPSLLIQIILCLDIFATVYCGSKQAERIVRGDKQECQACSKYCSLMNSSSFLWPTKSPLYIRGLNLSCKILRLVYITYFMLLSHVPVLGEARQLETEGSVVRRSFLELSLKRTYKTSRTMFNRSFSGHYAGDTRFFSAGTRRENN